MATLSLEEFRATRRPVEDVNVVVHGWKEEQPAPGYVYADLCYINSFTVTGGHESYFLTIYNQEWMSDVLEELEERLYKEFYLPEVCGRV